MRMCGVFSLLLVVSSVPVLSQGLRRQGLGILPTEEENVPLLSVETVLGMMTNLPCNITPSVPGDQVLIVLWYKDGYGKPIYSFDLRHEASGEEEEEGKLWA